MELKLYIVNHVGIWLSGKSIAIAENEARAKELVMKKYNFSELEIYDIQEVEIVDDYVDMIDDGDY